jgi:high-affinity Fe2+/Pb2+ permease
MEDKIPAAGIVLTERQLRNRRLRNLAIGLSVGLLAALFYAITIVKLGPGVLRPEP